jgi:long-chain acyl-CoA synthetase
METEQQIITTPANFLATAARENDAAAYFVRGETAWLPTSWTAFEQQVRRAARGLLALGVMPGDKISILAYNRPEWVIMDLAAMMVGAIPAGIYFTAAPAEVAFIVKDSGSVVLAVENAAQYAKIASKQNELGTLRRVVIMEGQAPDPWVIEWRAFSELGGAALDAEIEKRLAAIEPRQAGTLIYTSGTTGTPKAVELSHAALSRCVQVLQQTTPRGPADRVISYLPLAHIAEQMLSIHSFVDSGAKLYFAKSVQDLSAHLPEVRPTLMFGVPRVWEKLVSALREKLSAATGPKAKIAEWAQATGREWHRLEREATRPPAVLDIQKRIAEKLVYSKVKAAIGLDAARLLFSGAAPIAPEVLEFLAGLDVVVYELYGQSETCGPTTSNIPGANRIGSVGRAVPGTQLRIAEDGEVLVLDNKLFTGYAGRPDATAAALVDGWLYSGDLGRLDDDGYLYITGRKKDLIITAGGKNISPAPIEAALEAVPMIEHAVIVGDRRPFCTALITLNPDHLASFAKTHGISHENARHHAAVHAEVQRGVDEVNAEQSRVAAVRKFLILPGRFGVDTGELTPTLKIKRAVILENYKTEIEALYEREKVSSAF